jgi:hypothetical protein
MDTEVRDRAGLPCSSLRILPGMLLWLCSSQLLLFPFNPLAGRISLPCFLPLLCSPFAGLSLDVVDRVSER